MNIQEVELSIKTHIKENYEGEEYFGVSFEIGRFVRGMLSKSNHPSDEDLEKCLRNLELVSAQVPWAVIPEAGKRQAKGGLKDDCLFAPKGRIGCRPSERR